MLSRYLPECPASLAAGWTLRRLTPPSRLFGANGLTTGADGRIYVAQVAGSQISAVDPETGVVEAISPKGGGIVGPDDLVFDEDGNLYATEITANRVSVMEPNGRTRVVWGDVPVANPITWHKGMLIAGELRMGARIRQLDLAGGEPRIIAENLPMPNAFQVGPDGMLYFPVMAANEIWRVSLAGGAPEVVARDLGVPDSVKFDAQGRIVSTQVGSGQVLRIDPATGTKEVLAEIAPGLDNVTFVGDRIFVSSVTGQVNEVLGGGKTRNVVPDGLCWPLGLAVGADGKLIVADGSFTWELQREGGRRLLGRFFLPDYPGYCRGIATAGAGELVVTTANGEVMRWNYAAKEKEVLAQGYDRLHGVALAPDGAVVFAEAGAGRVHLVKSGKAEILASGLAGPKGVATSADGTIYVAETGGGRVVKLGRQAETVLDGLQQPEGVLVLEEKLYVLEALGKNLVEYDLLRRKHAVIAGNLPVGAPPGVVPKQHGPIGELSGPMAPFAGIAAGPDGTIYVSADAEGSVLAVQRE